MKLPTFLTLSLLLASSLLAQTNVGFQAGVSVVDVTPQQNIDTMFDMNRRATLVDTVHDPLFSKVIILADGSAKVALISIDLIWADPELIQAIRDGIRDKTGIGNTICALTHTHGSGTPTETVSQRIIEATVAAAVEANRNLEPARIGYGSGSVDESYNRRLIKEDGTVEMLWTNKDRIRTSPVDNEVGVISIIAADDDATIATIVNYNAHPVISMNFNELIVSADYPGALANRVESALGGHCFFFLGAAGDINAYDAAAINFGTEEEVFAKVERLAESLSSEVEKIVSGIDNFDTKPSLAFDSYQLAFAKREDGPHGEKNHASEVSTLLIGDEIALATFPGELFVELGMELKAKSPADLTLVISCANGLDGYLPTTRACCEGGYGASSATRLEVGAGERMAQQALVSILHQSNSIKPLEQ